MRNRFISWIALSTSCVLGCSSADSESDIAGAHIAAPASVGAAGAAAVSGGQPTSPQTATTQAPAAASQASVSAMAAPTLARAAGAGGAAAKSSVAPPSSSQGRFDAVGTNPFVIASHDPFSTFAADVDTASYDIFRRDTERAYLTEAASVRVEEFVNYFEYGYPAPASDAEHPFRIDLAATRNPLGREDMIVRVGIQAEQPPVAARKQANLVFLVDVSGSMGDDGKIELVKSLLSKSLDVLRPEDKVSIVTYAGTTSVRLAPTEVAQRGQIRDVIQSLTAGGSTNGAGGMQLAYDQAEAAFVQDGINHIVMCTDGDFNVGISSPDALVELVKGKRESGITLTTLGFGFGNLNDAMMEKVSNAGNGIYSVVSSETQARRYAEDRLLRTFVHVAKDLKIQLEWNPERVNAYRLIGYEDRLLATSDFRDDKVDAGEVGAGHRVTALYEVVLKDQQLPEIDGAPDAESGEPVDGEREIGKDDLLLVKVRYKQPGASTADEAAEVVERLGAGTNVPAFAEADQDTRYSVAIASFAEVLKKSPYAAPDKLDVLREVFASQAERDIERAEFLELFDKTRSLMSASGK